MNLCFGTNLGQIWTNLAVFLTQRLGLSIFDPKFGLKLPSIFRDFFFHITQKHIVSLIFFI